MGNRGCWYKAKPARRRACELRAITHKGRYAEANVAYLFGSRRMYFKFSSYRDRFNRLVFPYQSHEPIVFHIDFGKEIGEQLFGRRKNIRRSLVTGMGVFVVIVHTPAGKAPAFSSHDQVRVIKAQHTLPVAIMQRQAITNTVRAGLGGLRLPSVAS